MVSSPNTVSGVDRLSEMLGMSVQELENFSPQYKHAVIKKRSGGNRLLQMPNDETKRVQRLLLDKLIGRYKTHVSCCGFSKGLSIIDNARPHVGQETVIKLDIQDFFPNTAVERIREFFCKTGWTDDAADVLTKLVVFDQGLPQGAPTSPAVSNVVNCFMDLRLDALAKKYGMTYTRYADDLTFSSEIYSRRDVHKILRITGVILKSCGYSLNKKKKRIIRKHRRQSVTGIVVNERLNIARPTRRWLRSVHHRLESGGNSTLSENEFNGWISYLRMVNPKDPLVTSVFGESDPGKSKRRRSSRYLKQNTSQSASSNSGQFNPIADISFRPINRGDVSTLSQLGLSPTSNAVTPSEYFSAQLFYNFGKNVNVVARRRNLKRKTVWKHLAHAVEHSLVACHDLISKEDLSQLLSQLKQHSPTAIPSVGDAYRMCMGQIDYGRIRVGLAECRRRKRKLQSDRGNEIITKLNNFSTTRGEAVLKTVLGKRLNCSCAVESVSITANADLPPDYTEGRTVHATLPEDPSIPLTLFTPAAQNDNVDSLSSTQNVFVRGAIQGVDDVSGCIELLTEELQLRT